MIIKTFRAETSAAALKRVREEMGGDAVVLKTTQISGTGSRPIFEVTACLENPTVSQSNMIFPDTDPFVETVQTENIIPDQESTTDDIIETVKEQDNKDNIWKERFQQLDNRLNQILKIVPTEETSRYAPFEDIFEQLTKHDFDPGFIQEFINELKESFDDSGDVISFAEQKLVEKISSFMVPQFSIKPGDHLAVVGPAGSGKSSIIGKLATNLIIKEKQKVTLLTLDDVKMGACDETAAYAEILGAKYADTRTAIDEINNSDNTITLIDTVAMPAVIENLKPICDKLDAVGTTYRLAVFSAITRSHDIAAMAEHINALEATHLVITMTDMTDCLGSIITAAHISGLKIVYTTNSQGGVGNLNTPDPAQLVRELLKTKAAVSE